MSALPSVVSSGSASLPSVSASCSPSLARPAVSASPSSGLVAVCGGRSLPGAFAPLVGRVCRSLVGSGRSLVVGCAVGADAFVLSSGVPPSAVHVFAAFGPGGVGSCPVSNVAGVSAFAAAGGSVCWWRGGPRGVAVASRLVCRSQSVVVSASAGLVCFFASPQSRGSLLACQLAAGRGLPVVAFACGFPASALPLLGPGSWSAVGGSGCFSSGFRWVPAQSSLFS